MDIAVAAAPSTDPPGFADRKRTADRVYRGALLFNSALTVFWLFALLTGRGGGLFGQYDAGRDVMLRIGSGILFFYVIWGFIWYGVKTLLLRYFVGFSKEERRQAFSS